MLMQYDLMQTGLFNGYKILSLVWNYCIYDVWLNISDVISQYATLTLQRSCHCSVVWQCQRANSDEKYIKFFIQLTDSVNQELNMLLKWIELFLWSAHISQFITKKYIYSNGPLSFTQHSTGRWRSIKTKTIKTLQAWNIPRLTLVSTQIPLSNFYIYYFYIIHSTL